MLIALADILQHSVCVWGEWTSLADALLPYFSNSTVSDEQLHSILYKYLHHHHIRLEVQLQDQGISTGNVLEAVAAALRDVLAHHPHLWGHWKVLAAVLLDTGTLPTFLTARSLCTVLEEHNGILQRILLEQQVPHKREWVLVAFAPKQ